MSRWLQTASRALGGGTRQLEPEPFQIECACGHLLEGLRQLHHQRAQCRHCGESIFILPVDVYPKLKPKKPRKKRKTQQTSAETASVVEDAGPRLGRRLRNKAGEIATLAATALKRTLRRQLAVFTPFRLVVLTMAAIICVTSYWVWQQRAREQAEVRLKSAFEHGEAAFRQRDFIPAARELRIAAEALSLLGRDDQQARGVRQMLRESTAINHLASESLFEIANGLPDALRENPSGWDDDFRNAYGDKWVVIETNVARTVGPDGNRQVMIDYPLVVRGRAVWIDADLPAFEPLSLSKEGRKVIFAAQIESCRLVGSAQTDSSEHSWVIKLRAESGFLWCGSDSYRALGFEGNEAPVEQEILRLLDEQSRLTGIEP